MDVVERAVGGTIRVLVADDSRIYTRLLADALTRDPVLQVTAYESDSSGLVSASLENAVDVLVVSSTLDEQPSLGIDLVRQMRMVHPGTRAVLLLDSSKDEVVLDAFRAGAKGIFGRTDSLELLSKCVRCVYQGQIWACSRHVSIALGALANSPVMRPMNAKGMSLLSERELQVVGCLREGLSNREIAKRLNLSQHTVKNYFFRIFDKLGVSSRVELLYMSVSHAAPEPAILQHPPIGLSGGKSPNSELDSLRKSAENGEPAAQLALAQLYLARRSDPQDVVEAYMWYLIATESAMQARGFITKMLTVEQIEEAKHKASGWLAKKKKRSAAAAAPSESEPDSAGAKALLGVGDRSDFGKLSEGQKDRAVKAVL